MSTRKDGTEGRIPDEGIAKWLEEKFGLGDQPRQSRFLYSRIQRCCAVHGEAAREVVRDSIESARMVGQRESVFFRWVCRVRLVECGLWNAENRSDTLKRIAELSDSFVRPIEAAERTK